MEERTIYGFWGLALDETKKLSVSLESRYGARPEEKKMEERTIYGFWGLA